MVRNTINVLFFGALWLLSVILILLSILAVREIFLWGVSEILLRNSPAHDYQAAGIIDTLHFCLVTVLGIVGLTVAVISSEFGLRRAGKPGSLRVLLLLIVAECAVVLPVALIFWRNQ